MTNVEIIDRIQKLKDELNTLVGELNKHDGFSDRVQFLIKAHDNVGSAYYCDEDGFNRSLTNGQIGYRMSYDLSKFNQRVSLKNPLTPEEVIVHNYLKETFKK